MNKTVLITGASSGIGEAAAIFLKEAGYTVYGAARRTEKMKTLKDKGIQVLSLDVTEDESMIKCIDTIISEQGRLDILVNNAGYGSYGALEDVSISEAKRQFEVNIFGLARLTQLALPHMRKQNSGKIINVSSIGGRFGEPHGAWYHATKFALEGLSDSLRMELKEFKIDVVVIQPGAIYTEWNKIARDKLIEVSGKTAYKDLAIKHANMLEKYDKTGSHPNVIAKTILKAAVAKTPKTRYAAGYGAKPFLFIGKVLSDRMFDRLMLSQMRK